MKINTKFHYTYMITELSTNMKYIGVRTSSCLPEDDIGINYFSSSKDKAFIKRQKRNRTDYQYVVINIFEERLLANLDEVNLHEYYDVGASSDFYNKANARISDFCAYNKVVVQDKYCNIFRVDVTDERYLSGELVSINKGMVSVKNKDGKYLYVSITDDRYLSGEFIPANKGSIVVKHEDGYNMQITVDEYRTGKYKHVNDKMAIVVDKNKNILRVQVDDHRYLSGELKPLASTKFRGKFAANGVNVTVDLDDPRIKTGEIIGITTGLVSVRDSSGKCFMCSQNDPKFLSGEYKGVTAGKFVGKDKYGNKYPNISNTDERVLAGEIVHHSSNWYKVDNEIYSMKQLKLLYPDINVSDRIKSEKYPNWICIGKVKMNK